MVKYKVPQSELDEDNKNKILGMIKYYTIKEGGIDFDKINPVTFLSSSYGISLEDVEAAISTLITETKIEEA